MARYRLRFYLQEIDLQPGATYVGRSDDCEVTLEDPLVSRRHARMLLHAGTVTLEDLDSRNGVRVNGKLIKGSRELVDGDRVRIGTQDFVLCLVQKKVGYLPRTTGVLRLCSECKAPYARELLSCPSCGANNQTEEAPLSGTFGPDAQHSWSVQLLVAALKKALGLGRFVDADRILRRASALIDERIASAETIQPEQLAELADAAAKICLETQQPFWGVWIPTLYLQISTIPPASVIERLVGLRQRHEDMEEPIARLFAHCQGLSAPSPAEDREALARLGRARRSEPDSLPQRPTVSPLHLN